MSAQLLNMSTSPSIYTYNPKEVDNKYHDYRLSAREFRKYGGFKCGCCEKPHIFKTTETFNVHLKSDIHKKNVESKTKTLEYTQPLPIPDTIPDLVPLPNIARLDWMRMVAQSPDTSTRKLESVEGSNYTQEDSREIKKLNNIIENQKKHIEQLNQHIKNQNQYIQSLTDLQLL